MSRGMQDKIEVSPEEQERLERKYGEDWIADVVKRANMKDKKFAQILAESLAMLLIERDKMHGHIEDTGGSTKEREMLGKYIAQTKQHVTRLGLDSLIPVNERDDGEGDGDGLL